MGKVGIRQIATERIRKYISEHDSMLKVMAVRVIEEKNPEFLKTTIRMAEALAEGLRIHLGNIEKSAKRVKPKYKQTEFPFMRKKKSEG